MAVLRREKPEGLKLILCRIGYKPPKFPGFDLTPGPEFWALLPTFAILTLVLGIKAISYGVIIQQSSQREPRTIDFRRVQGTVSANGVGMVLAGIVGTPPTLVYSSFSVSLINFTGVAARSVGYAMGVILLVLALFPKVRGVLLIIPSPVMGSLLLIEVAMLFWRGYRPSRGPASLRIDACVAESSRLHAQSLPQNLNSCGRVCTGEERTGPAPQSRCPSWVTRALSSPIRNGRPRFWALLRSVGQSLR